MAEQRVYLLTGGGTGGHVYPGLALAAEVERLSPGARIVWVGTSDRLEARAVPRAGYAFETVDVHFLKGRRGWALVRALGSLPRAGAASLAVIRRHRPVAVVGLGGFVSGPVCAAAAALGVPVFLLEQNARPGVTNRAVSRLARRVYASFEASREHFPAERVRVMGNPVRRELVASARREGSRADGPPRLLVFGGSQGAASINEQVPRIVGAVVASGVEVEVRHATGAGRDADVRRAWDQVGVAAEVTPYIDDMGEAYRWCDLAVCRAGATTIAELTAVGRPAMYVPFPYAADDHQTANALAVVEAGGGVMVADDEMSGERPARLLGPLLRHLDVLEKMGAAAGRLGRPDAASEVARDLMTLVG